jgi:hypothetical protein
LSLEIEKDQFLFSVFPNKIKNDFKLLQK